MHAKLYFMFMLSGSSSIARSAHSFARSVSPSTASAPTAKLIADPLSGSWAMTFSARSSARRVGLREVIVDRNGAPRRGQAAVTRSSVVEPQRALRVRHQRPRMRIVGIDLGGALAKPDDRLAAAGVADVSGDAVLARHQVQLVSLRVGRAAPFDRFLLFGEELQLERGHDRLRNLVLQREDVIEVAVVALGPDVPAGRAVDQLRRDPYPATGLARAALQNVVDLELARDLRNVDVLALEHERRVARGDPQRGHLGEIRDDVLGDAVREVFLFRIAAHVGERE